MDANGQKIKVSFDHDLETTCFIGTQVRNLMKKIQLPKTDLPYLGALVNNEIVTLTYPLEVDSHIKLLTIEDSNGWRIYKDSIAFILSKAVRECFPDLKFEIDHAIGNAYYCSFNNIPDKFRLINILDMIEIYMRGLIDAKIPIIRRKLYLENAIRYFAKHGCLDKTKLLHFTNDAKIAVFQCENFFDLAYGIDLSDNTEHLNQFKLLPYDDKGFVIQFPEMGHPVKIVEFKKLPHLFNIFKAYKTWGRTIGLRTVGDLNEIIVRGDFRNLISIEEAYQEKRIADIADQISERRNSVKWVLIAGPSSSGKTTFAHRLGTQIKVNGITPVVISVDNYFRNREETPLDEYGNYDFEHIETIDLELLHEHLSLLDQGKSVDIPEFDFKVGKRVWTGRQMRLEENEVAVIEGIHSLNPRMTESLPHERKFGIYINALTQLNVDCNHRISTTDNRLLRRILRDHRTRGNRALATLNMWENVRKGEDKWIFPFESNAQCAFSSALNYELAVLKPRVEPLLGEVKPWHKQYATARRLQFFLRSFMAADKTDIPHNSLLREFVGDGIIR